MNYYLYNTETLWAHNKFYMSISNKNNETTIEAPSPTDES